MEHIVPFVLTDAIPSAYIKPQSKDVKEIELHCLTDQDVILLFFGRRPIAAGDIPDGPMMASADLAALGGNGPTSLRVQNPEGVTVMSWGGGQGYGFVKFKTNADADD